MKKRIKLTEEEKHVLLYQGNFISIPKYKEDRKWESTFDESIKRIEILQYIPKVYMRDGKKWYVIDKEELPRTLQEDFFREDILIENYKIIILTLFKQLRKIPNPIKKLLGIKNIPDMNTIQKIVDYIKINNL